MPSQRTGAQLIQSVRENANEESPNPTSAFVTDVEILRRIVEAQYALYDLMRSADQHLFVAAPATFTLTASNSFALSGLPDPGFYAMLGLDFNTGGSAYAEVHRFTFGERNRQNRRAYSLEGSNLTIYPEVGFAGTYRLWYAPRITELTSGGLLDVFTDNYQAYIIAAATVAVMSKAEESDPASYLAVMAKEEARILQAIASRNSEPEQIPDVTGSYGPDGGMNWYG
ncbi:MAG: hypothetical protein ABJA82_05350 [Myxococcales bacterium]